MNPESSEPSALSTMRVRLFSSLGWKVATLLFLGLVLLIPLSMIEGLLRERTYRKAEAVHEIGQQWGAAQSVYGPFLRVPVLRVEERNERVIVEGVVQDRIRKIERRDFLILLPETYRLEGEVASEIRYRGIFRAPVFTSDLSFTGFWKKEEPAAYGIPDTEIEWNRATLLFRVTDSKGLTKIRVGGAGEGNPPRPVYLEDNLEWIEVDHPVVGDSREIGLDLSFGLQGSESISFLPVGRNGEAKLSSDWEDPSFIGARLPVSRTVTDSGFVAHWSFGEFGRNYAQYWLEQNGAPRLLNLDSGMSGVELVDPIDGYRLTERSLKYGSLFIALGFIVFFLFEALCGLRLHPMHYLLAGAAQALFFLLVLALSEVLDFGIAYSVAAFAASALISLYAASVLGGGKRAGLVGAALAALYTVLFVILREQDYALLAGSGLLFVALAAVMWLTRRLDWSGAARELVESEGHGTMERQR